MPPYRRVIQTAISLQGEIIAQIKENPANENACTVPVYSQDPVSQVQSIGILISTAAEILGNLALASICDHKLNAAQHPHPADADSLCCVADEYRYFFNRLQSCATIKHYLSSVQD